MEERLKSESIEDNCSGKTPETAPLLHNTAARCANDDDDDDDDADDVDEDDVDDDDDDDDDAVDAVDDADADANGAM